MAVGAEAEELQVDPARAANRALVAFALGRDVSHRAVQKMDPPRREIDVVEQMPLHEGAIAARIATVEAEELVEVEGRGAAKTRAAGAVPARDFVIQRNRRAAGRQAEHQTRVVAKRRGDGGRQRVGGSTGCGEDFDSHRSGGRANSAPTYTSES